MDETDRILQEISCVLKRNKNTYFLRKALTRLLILERLLR
jgi:hypothetical protein